MLKKSKFPPAHFINVCPPPPPPKLLPHLNPSPPPLSMHTWWPHLTWPFWWRSGDLTTDLFMKARWSYQWPFWWRSGIWPLTFLWRPGDLTSDLFMKANDLLDEGQATWPLTSLMKVKWPDLTWPLPFLMARRPDHWPSWWRSGDMTWPDHWPFWWRPSMPQRHGAVRPQTAGSGGSPGTAGTRFASSGCLLPSPPALSENINFPCQTKTTW